MKQETILIVEDEFIVANDLRIMLKKAGFGICGIAASVDQARQLIATKKPDWILLDIILQGKQTGIDLARELMQKRMPFLYVSANTNQSTLEAARTTQPYGFLVKPFREKDLMVMLDIARYRHQVETGIFNTATATSHKGIEDIVGNSAALQQALDKITTVANTDTSVLLLGESGTGKEKAALAIHQLSDRRSKPFITLNCAALPEALIESELFGHERGAFTGAATRRTGKFEQANGGTLFLDEIGEMPPGAQAKLLRVLQEKEIERLGGDKTIKLDVRIITATNRNLEKEVAGGRFRLDLYFRLNVFPVQLPPLRERKEDIPELAFYFLEQYAQKHHKTAETIHPLALAQLQRHNWPGNIRELQHLIERHVLLAAGKVIERFQLPEFLQETTATDGRIKTLEELERDHIMQVLKACKGKVSGAGGAAEALNIPAGTLYSKLKKLGIKQGYQ